MNTVSVEVHGYAVDGGLTRLERDLDCHAVWEDSVSDGGPMRAFRAYLDVEDMTDTEEAETIVFNEFLEYVSDTVNMDALTVQAVV